MLYLIWKSYKHFIQGNWTLASLSEKVLSITSSRDLFSDYNIAGLVKTNTVYKIKSPVFQIK